MTIYPRNWKTFQHYNRRNPPWIKLHKRLLDDYEFQRLSAASKALAVQLWLLASESEDGAIEGGVEAIAFRLRSAPADIETALAPLLEAGFFSADNDVAPRKQDASNALSSRRQRATPETETEAETERETEGLGGISKSTSSIAATTRAGAKDKSPVAVDRTPPGEGLPNRLANALNGIKASLGGKPRPETAPAPTQEEILKNTKKVPGAYIQNQSGSKWGSHEDLLLAHIIFSHLRDLVPKSRIKQPKWLDWADALRLLREEGGVDTKACTAAFERAAADPKLGKLVISPAQLKRHWDRIAALPAATNGHGQAWYESKAGILAKAIEHGVEIANGEQLSTIIGRINAKLQAQQTHH